MQRLTRPRIVRTDLYRETGRITVRGVDHLGNRIQRTVKANLSTKEKAKLYFLAKLEAETPDKLSL